MDEQRNVKNKGGTMRLGAYPCTLKEGTLSHQAYGEINISERHRHRYELNNKFKGLLEDKGMVMSGLSPDGKLVEIIELPDHPWFVGVQFHPELKSRAVTGSPLFISFISAALKYRRKKNQ
jgi:CTP synthase